MNEYSAAFDTNKAFWNAVSSAHYQSDLYDVPGFLNGKSSLNAIEEEFLQHVKGKTVLHIQCHFGLDSLSLVRKGAKVVATDFSNKSLELAKALAVKADLECQFIECNTYELSNSINESFDLVFLSYGAIPWLPSMDTLAEQIDTVTSINSRVLLVEFHPALYMFDFPAHTISYDYFNTKMYKETEEGSYAQQDGKTREQCFWNHPLGEVFNAFSSKHFQLEHFKEYDYSPYNCFDDMVEEAPGKFSYNHNGVKIPHVYAMQWTKSQ